MPPSIRDVRIAEKYVYVFVCRIIAGLGIAGNLLNLIILRRKALSDSPYTYLTALAVSDFLVLAFMLGLGSIRCGDCKLNQEEAFYGKIYEYFIYLPFSNMGSLTSIFLAVTMTIERFIFVRFPLQARTICVKKIARRIVVIVAFVSIIIHMPRFFMYDIKFNQRELKRESYILECIFSPSQGNVFSSAAINGNNTCFISSLKNTTMNETLITGLTLRWEINITAKPSANIKHNDIKNSRYSLFYFFPISKEIWNKKEMTAIFQKNDSEYLNNFILKCGSCASGNKNSDCIPSDEWQLLNENCKFLYFNWSHLTKSTLLQVDGAFQPEILNITCLLEMRNSNSNELIRNLEKKNLKISDYTQGRFILNAEPEFFHSNMKPFHCPKENETNNENAIIATPMEPVIVTTTNFYDRFYKVYFYTVISLEIISTFTMVACNVYLIKTLRHSYRKHQRLRAFQGFPMKWLRDQHRLTITLVIITTLSIVCVIFTILVSDPNGYYMFGVAYKNSSFFQVLLLCNNLAYIISNSINFLLYAVFNIRFRKEMSATFQELLQCCLGIERSRQNFHTNKAKNRESYAEVFTTSDKASRLDSTSTVEEQESTRLGRISISSISENNQEQNDNLFL